MKGYFSGLAERSGLIPARAHKPTTTDDVTAATPDAEPASESAENNNDIVEVEEFRYSASTTPVTSAPPSESAMRVMDSARPDSEPRDHTANPTLIKPRVPPTTESPPAPVDAEPVPPTPNGSIREAEIETRPSAPVKQARSDAPVHDDDAPAPRVINRYTTMVESSHAPTPRAPQPTRVEARQPADAIESVSKPVDRMDAATPTSPPARDAINNIHRVVETRHEHTRIERAQAVPRPPRQASPPTSTPNQSKTGIGVHIGTVMVDVHQPAPSVPAPTVAPRREQVTPRDSGFRASRHYLRGF